LPDLKGIKAASAAALSSSAALLPTAAVSFLSVARLTDAFASAAAFALSQLSAPLSTAQSFALIHSCNLQSRHWLQTELHQSWLQSHLLARLSSALDIASPMVSDAFSFLLCSRHLRFDLTPDSQQHSTMSHAILAKTQLPVPSEGGKHTMNDSIRHSRSHLGTVAGTVQPQEAHEAPKRFQPDSHRYQYSKGIAAGSD